MSWTRSGKTSSDPSKETPERWEVRSFSGGSLWAARPDSFQPLPSRPGPLTPRAFLNVVAGDEGGAAGLGEPHAQSLALASVRFPHQECLRTDRVGGPGPAPLPPTR